ncbi:MAG: AgmX/PglI C-terminal domain-containing protein [Bdellovibrionales bacterium]|nr:AgmX/PglI C-terminal domain-containing protein [Bdellovibrionales bacterium]
MSAQKKMIQSKQVFTYLVKVVAGPGESTRVWNTKQPMVVGHPMRWEMVQTDEGVKISALWTEKEHLVKDADIAKGKGSVKLVCGTAKDAGTLQVEIQPVAKLAAAFRQEPTVGSSLKVFHVIGEWAVESVALGSSYVGKAGAAKVFKLKGNAEGVYTSDAFIEIVSYADGLQLASGKTELKLAKGETRRVKFSDISGVILRHGNAEWRLATFMRDEDPTFLAAPLMADEDAVLFKRTAIGAIAATLLLGLISFLMPTPPPVAKVETVKILLKKKHVVAGHATAAPTGDPSARDLSIGKSGSAKNAGRKGALAQSKKVAPAGKPQARVAAHKAAPKMHSSAPKAVAKAAPKKSAPKHAVAKAASPKKSHSTAVAHAPNKGGLKRVATVASRPAPIPHSALFKAFSSGSIQRTAKGLSSGGSVSAAAYANSGDASRYGSAGGTGRGDLGGAGGVDTRSASISGFGGGGNADGEGGPGSKGAGYGRGSNSKVSGQGRSFVSMDTGASDVEEGLTSDQVARVINSHMNEVRYCYESATLRNDSIGGRLMTKFAVGASGSVASAGVGSSTVGDRRLHDCIVSHLRGWKFPKPRGGKTVAVLFPFDFKTLTR